MEKSLLDIIHIVLNQVQKPLTAEAILKEIKSNNLYDFTGKTPKTAIRARLAENIDQFESASQFVRLQKGTFGLRKWLIESPGQYKEYEAKKKRNQLMDEYLAVFNRDTLPQIVSINGLNEVPIDSNWFKNNCTPMVRHEAEDDYSVVQLISVFIIKFKDKIITHTRSAKAPESRLHGERSIVFGGHITYEEVNSLFDPFDPNSTHPFIKRELEEEITVSSDSVMTPIGLLYDSTRDVSSQHLGLVYLVEMINEDYEIGEKGYHINDELTHISDVIKNKSDYENWSVELIDKILNKGKY
ncbi:HTH domain-containing protein [Thalassotalea hakodatensis]|uniref:HTH domain-containing protein n=1 Tax=Thalassotalea hakodatensis TaxID=3030492 RepID=UPI00257464B1|nr:HTH domain-containing protein [Thalassotalea hakodatensis]